MKTKIVKVVVWIAGYIAVLALSFASIFHILEVYRFGEVSSCAVAACGSIIGVILTHWIITGNFIAIGLIWTIFWKYGLSMGIPVIVWINITDITWRVVITVIIIIFAVQTIIWIEDSKKNKCPFNL